MEKTQLSTNLCYVIVRRTRVLYVMQSAVTSGRQLCAQPVPQGIVVVVLVARGIVAISFSKTHIVFPPTCPNPLQKTTFFVL